MSEFHSKFDLIRTIDVKINVSDYEVGPNVNMNHPPDKLVNNDNYDGSRRWAAYGPMHYIDFTFDQELPVYGLNIAFYGGNSCRYTFEILSNSVSEILWKGQSAMGSGYEVYKFNEMLHTRNIRILMRGNNLDQWNAITAVRFRLDPISEPGVPRFPDCPPGQHWHDALQTCIPDIIKEPPKIVIADPVQTVVHGSRVMIDASKTTDPNGVSVFYEWNQIGGEQVNMGNTLQPNLIFTVPTIDTELSFRLRAVNSANLSSTATAKVVVRKQIPQCPPGTYWDEDEKRCIDNKPQPEPAVKKPKTKRKRQL